MSNPAIGGLFLRVLFRWRFVYCFVDTRPHIRPSTQRMRGSKARARGRNLVYNPVNRWEGILAQAACCSPRAPPPCLRCLRVKGYAEFRCDYVGESDQKTTQDRPQVRHLHRLSYFCIGSSAGILRRCCIYE